MDKNYNAGKAVGFGDYGGYGCFSITVAVPARAVTIAEWPRAAEKAKMVEKMKMAKMAENGRATVCKIAA